MDPVHQLSAFGSLCLLCSSLSLGLAPGLSLEGGYSYLTLERHQADDQAVVGFDRHEAADTTPHAISLQASYRRAGPRADGVVTLPLEVTGGVVEATSHTEAITGDFPDAEQVISSGNSRMETIWATARLPLGPGSVELGVERPYYKSDEVYGPDLLAAPKVRRTFNDTRLYALGYRGRGDGWEIALHGLYSSASLRSSTTVSYTNGTARLGGADLELAARLSRVTASLSAGHERGTVSLVQGFTPGLAELGRDEPFRRTFVTVAACLPAGRFRFTAEAQLVRIQAPFWDWHAELNGETALQDRGYTLATRSTDGLLRLSAAYSVRPGAWLLLSASRRTGTETVDHLGRAPSDPPVSVSIERTGWSAGASVRVTLP